MNKTISQKMQCFISHCSEDRSSFTDDLEKILQSLFDPNEYSFFYSSGISHTTSLGEGLSDELRKNLKKSKLMIAVISDSYLRSIVSVAEISAFWFNHKPVIPIIFSKNGEDFFKKIMGEDIIILNLAVKEHDHITDCAIRMINALKHHGFFPKNEDLAAQEFHRLFLEGKQASPINRPYIGSGEKYNNIYKYCERNGIKRLTNTTLNGDELKEKISGCKELFIVATTGANLINRLSNDFLPSALAEGMKLTVLIPNCCSSYIYDVAEIEAPENITRHKKRFENEFDNAVTLLLNCMKNAKEKNPDCCGEIYLGCAHTLIRQTIILAVWDDRFWGWLSMTIPPYITVQGTPSFEFSCYRKDREDDRFAKLIYGHILAIKDIAERRHNYYCLSENSDFKQFYLENERAEGYWNKLYEKAKQNSFGRGGNKELIEIAAQHPLSPDGKPGIEFSKRLDYGVTLYHQLINNGCDVKIYVPGSIHRYNGNVDKCSLSEAGKAYLLEKGIPGEDILGEAENTKYKNENGVYNSADECFVAAQIFFDGQYHRLHCVCSPNQLPRKKLFYIAFGVIPFFYTVNSENYAHDDIYELLYSIPDIIAYDHTWQSPDSFQWKRTRADRDPNWI